MALSGGLDSSTLLAFLLSGGYEVECVFFTYGSKHNQYEKIASRNIADFYDVPLYSLNLENISEFLKSDLLKSGGAIPEGHYEAPNMSATVVPGRNIIFLSIMAGIAWSKNAQYVAAGIHAGDHAIYPDCRPDFFKAMDLALYLGTDKKIEMIAPFVEWNKIDIAKWGIQNGVPYHLTRTCYKDQEFACGKCGACTERLEAFALNNSADLAQYE